MRVCQVLDTRDHGAGTWSVQTPAFLEALSAAGVEIQTAAPAHEPLAADRWDVDLVHVHGWTGRATGRLLRVLAKGGVRHLISTYGCWTQDHPRPGLWWRRLLGGFGRPPLPPETCVHAVSGREADHLRSRGFDGRIEVLPMGVDAAGLAAPTAPSTEPTLPGDLALPADRRILLYLGPMDQEPGLPPFLKACDDLEDDLAAWRVVLAGKVSRTWRELFAASARRHSKPELATLVPSPSSLVQSALLQAADLLVCPIAGDRPAVGALQAMACGVPVLVSATADLNEIASHNAGRICPVERSAIRNSLAELVTLPAPALKELGTAGQKLVRERFAWPVLAPRYVELYRSLLK